MLIPKWFEEYGQGKACSGWYKLVPYGIHPKTKEERKHSESNQDKNKDKKDQNENIVSNRIPSRWRSKANDRSRKQCCQTG
jgi:hypothetical protein